jgi:hypothetical protein
MQDELVTVRKWVSRATLVLLAVLTVSSVVNLHDMAQATHAADAIMQLAQSGISMTDIMDGAAKSTVLLVVDALAKHMRDTAREFKRRELRAANEEAERRQAAALDL